MKNNHIFWGLILVIIGVLFVLRNIGVLDFHWYMVRKLWPLILVFAGVSMFPIKEHWKFLISLIFFLLGIYLITKFGENGQHIFHIHV